MIPEQTATQESGMTVPQRENVSGLAGSPISGTDRRSNQRDRGNAPTGESTRQESDETNREPAGPKRPWYQRVFAAAIWIFTSPIRLYLGFRRSLTAASVTLLLAMITGMNIIWGYPWIGMFSVCIAALTAGWAISWYLQPRLNVFVTVPRSAPVGQAFRISALLKNMRSLPAMELRVGWIDELTSPRRSKLPRFSASESAEIPMIRPQAENELVGAMRFSTRGVHKIPDLHVVSSFPFHLFRHRQSIASETSIAITPVPVQGDEDATAKLLRSAVGDWAKRLVAGAAIEYMGSREYQVGMPVRRWDFASWARLGRPIVREYQSPSIQVVSLLVDTALPPLDESSLTRAQRQKERRMRENWLERVFSLAATAVHDLLSSQIQLRLYITSEPTLALRSAANDRVATPDIEPLMIRLAAGTPSDVETSDERLAEVLESTQGEPVLLLTTRAAGLPRDEGGIDRDHLSSNVAVVEIPSLDSLDSPSPLDDDLSKSNDDWHSLERRV